MCTLNSEGSNSIQRKEARPLARPEFNRGLMVLGESGITPTYWTLHWFRDIPRERFYQMRDHEADLDPFSLGQLTVGFCWLGLGLLCSTVVGGIEALVMVHSRGS